MLLKNKINKMKEFAYAVVDKEQRVLAFVGNSLAIFFKKKEAEERRKKLGLYRNDRFEIIKVKIIKG